MINFYVKHIKGDGDKNILIFGSRNPKFNIDNPTTEFLQSLKNNFKNYFYIYDINHSWFLHDDIYKTINTLPKIDIAIGASMGGFGILYHQQILKSSKYIAFCPQMFVHKNTWKTLGEWHSIWSNDLLDDKNYVVPNPNKTIQYKIYYGLNINEQPHKETANKIKYNYKQIKTKSHHLTTYLKNENRLSTILLENT